MTLDPDRIAWVLLDAIALGDGAAARKWNVSRRTVERYRARMREDKELAALVAEKKSDAEVELSAMRVRFMRRAIDAMERKVMAGDATVYEIAGAIKVVGELHLVALSVEDDRSSGPDPEAEEAPRGSQHPPIAAH